MRRRRFLALAAAAPALWLPRSRASERGQVDITLTAAPRGTDWAYNGSVPGPTLEAREGDRVRVVFRNRLPQPSTIHWHGLSIPADQDGNPLHPVAPGEDRRYEFVLAEGSAGTYWYHPHVHGTTGQQVGRGLAGILLVRAAHDPLEGLADVPMMVTERLGVLLVNGLRQPRFAMRPSETQRWRVLNATGSRYLRLALQGERFTLAGTDGGLLPAPVEGLTELLLAPAERAEILVTAGPLAGRSLWLRSLAYDSGAMGMGMGMGMMGMPGAGRAQDLLRIDSVGAPAEPIALPAAYRAIEPLPRARTASRFVLTGGMMQPFAINGRRFDMRRVDAESRRGEVQRWEIHNAAAMDHPFHLHGTQFQVLGRAPLAWKDTVNVRAGETVSIAFRHEHAGLWMYHCHILEHEDAGMMGVLRVA